MSRICQVDLPQTAGDTYCDGMGLPERAEEESRKRLSSSLPRRWAHVESVAAEARRIAPAFDGDGPLLIAAAVLHDVGYAPELRDTGFHPVDGARHLSRLHMPQRLCALVAHHSCAAREASMRGLWTDLEEFRDEASPVRDALWYCDAVTGPDGARVTPEERWTEIEHRYGPDHMVSGFVRAARPDLTAAVQRTRAHLASSGVWSR